jgi:uncharacterized membrane protein
MQELDRSYPSSNFSQDLTLWVNRRFLWLSRHWLAFTNIFFLLYVGLPVLAPILMANGYIRSANTIYWLYHFACHQLPSRAYFIAGEQVPMCQRCIAIYATFVVGGLLFYFVRYSLKPLVLGWYILFLLPMALDGGLALSSELREFVPMSVLWALGLIGIGIVGAILYNQNHLTWHGYLFFSFGLLALIYLQIFGSHSSNVYLRTVTGVTFGVGTVWLVYPSLEEGFGDIRQEMNSTYDMPR